MNISKFSLISSQPTVYSNHYNDNQLCTALMTLYLGSANYFLLRCLSVRHTQEFTIENAPISLPQDSSERYFQLLRMSQGIMPLVLTIMISLITSFISFFLLCALDHLSNKFPHGETQDQSCLLDVLSGVPKMVLRLDDLQEGLTELRKMLFSWLQFISMKGYKFKISKQER